MCSFREGEAVTTSHKSCLCQPEEARLPETLGVCDLTVLPWQEQHWQNFSSCWSLPLSSASQNSSHCTEVGHPDSWGQCLCVFVHVSLEAWQTEKLLRLQWSKLLFKNKSFLCALSCPLTIQLITILTLHWNCFRISLPWKAVLFLIGLFEALYFSTCSPVVASLFTSFLSVFVYQI